MTFGNFRKWAGFYLNTDDLGGGVVSKILCLLVVLLRAFPHFLPTSYFDFTALEDWFTTIMNSEEISEEMLEVPFTRENYYFIGISFAVLFISILIAALYCGLEVRYFRQARNGLYLPVNRFIGRYIILCIFISAVIVPLFFCAVYLLLLFVLAIPFMCTIVPCYMSGDEGLIGSVTGVIKRTKGKYLMIMRDICGLYLIYLVLGILVSLVGLLSQTAYYVLNSALSGWYVLVAARFCAIQYTMDK